MNEFLFVLVMLSGQSPGTWTTSAPMSLEQCETVVQAIRSKEQKGGFTSRSIDMPVIMECVEVEK